MGHLLHHAIFLQDALLQVNDVGVLALDTAKGPELPQSQFHVLGSVAPDLFHGHAGTGPPDECFVHHTITATTNLPN